MISQRNRFRDRALNKRSQGDRQRNDESRDYKSMAHHEFTKEWLWCLDRKQVLQEGLHKRKVVLG